MKPYVKRKFLFLFVCLLTLIIFYQPFSAKPSQPIKILVLGNSLTAGYGVKDIEAFPRKLQLSLTRLGFSAKVINAGVSGDTTKGGLARLSWALMSMPDIVIIELGANDGLRGLPPAITKYNLDKIITGLKQNNVNVLLTGMLAPPNLGKKYGQKFNKIYRELAKKHNIPLYNFFLEGVANKPLLNQKDGIHPNAKGVDEIVRRIVPRVISVIRTINN